MESWGGLVRAVEQANRSVSGSKIPGGSNTPQDILKALKSASEKGEDDTLLGRFWKAAMVSKEFLEPAMERIGYGHLAMPLGLVGAVGSNVMSGFRNAGMAKVEGRYMRFSTMPYRDGGYPSLSNIDHARPQS
jgi:hypothetical protein